MFIALPTPLYYAYACVSLRFAYVCCFDNHTSLLILSLFSSIMCSSLCYRIADIAFSVCRTCVLYIFLLCFVSSPRIVVVGVHFCCLKNFFFIVEGTKMSSQVPFPPEAHSTSTAAARESFFYTMKRIFLFLRVSFSSSSLTLHHRSSPSSPLLSIASHRSRAECFSTQHNQNLRSPLS